MHVFACKCGNCDADLIRKTASKYGRYFCNTKCKATWQQSQKPATKEWLIQKYITEEMDCTQIAVIVQRDAKSVWNWLKGFGIPTRERGFASSATWRKPGQISTFKGKRHTDETKAFLRSIAIADGRVPFDRKVGPPLKGKRGSEVPTWKGGVTPERQAFYSSMEWKAVVPRVWKRDDATCQRCLTRKNSDRSKQFDIHHIVSFANRILRAELSNLVLLCEACHYWVHSAKNTDQLFIKDAE
jgi:hypothetical protein